MADAAIPLAVKQPQIDPSLELLQRGLSIQNLATVNQLNQVHLQQQRMIEQKAAEDREDANTIQQEFLNPTHLKPSPDDPTHKVLDWDSYRNSLNGKVRVRNLQQLDSDHLQQVKAIQDIATTDRTNQTAKLANRLATNKLIGQEIQGLQNLSDADKPAYYAGALQRLKAAGVDISQLPPTIPPDGSMNPQLQAYAASFGYEGTLLNDALRKQRAERLATQAQLDQTKAENQQAEEAAKAQQRARENAARSHLAVSNQQQHDAWLASLDPSIASEYQNLKQFTPETQRAVQQMAVTAQQRAQDAMTQQLRNRQDQQAQAQINAAEVRARIAQRHLEIDAARLDLERNRTGQAKNDAEADKLDSLLTKEQEQWSIHGALGELLDPTKVPDDTMIYNPLTKSAIPVKMDENLRRRIRQAYDSAESTALSIQKQGKDIQRRHGWGEFAPGGGASSGTGAPIGTAPNQAPVPDPRLRKSSMFPQDFQPGRELPEDNAGDVTTYWDTPEEAALAEKYNLELDHWKLSQQSGKSPAQQPAVPQPRPGPSMTGPLTGPGASAPPPAPAAKPTPQTPRQAVARPGNTVRMRAPNGAEKDVPSDQVEHYKGLGAVVVNR